MDKWTSRQTVRQRDKRAAGLDSIGLEWGLVCVCVCVCEWTVEQANTQGSAERVCRPRKLVASVPTSLQLAAWLAGCLVAPCHAGLHSVHSSLSTPSSRLARHTDPETCIWPGAPAATATTNSSSCSSCMGKSKRKFLLPNLLHATTPV